VTTYKLNLSVVSEHDLVLVREIAELFLGYVDPGLGDVVDLALLKDRL
jgi:hypothetical protein